MLSQMSCLQISQSQAPVPRGARPVKSTSDLGEVRAGREGGA